MIQVIKVPGKVALSENPVIFGIKSNNTIEISGTKAKVILYFGLVIKTGTGYQFSLTFGGNTYLFTMVASPDGSGLQFPKAALTDDNMTWMLKIKDALLANFYVSENYDITYNYNQVVLIAKYTGTAYNITGVNISVPNMSITSSAATDQVPRKYFKIFLQAMMGGMEIAADMLPVDAQGRAYFDISEYLKPEVSNSFTFPENAGVMLYKHPECCKNYSVKYAESYADADNPVIHKLYNAGSFYALTGGVNSMTQARYNLLSTNFWHQLQANHMFLTWHPGKKKTAQYDIQKLYFLIHQKLISMNVEHVNLYVGLNYKEPGSAAITTQIFLKSSIVATLYDVIEICCGYSRLALDVDAANLPAGSWVVSYDVFLKDDAGSIISEVKNYLVDDRTYMNYRSFIFRNSFGMYETIRCSSVQTMEANYENIVLNNYRQWNFSERVADSRKNQSFETARYLINTGLITEAEMQWSRELFMSKEVYEIKDNMLYPVVITSETVKLGKDREFLYDVEFEYIHGFTDQHYSLEKSVRSVKPQIIISENIGTLTNIHDYKPLHDNNSLGR